MATLDLHRRVHCCIRGIWAKSEHMIFAAAATSSTRLVRVPPSSMHAYNGSPRLRALVVIERSAEVLARTLISRTGPLRFLPLFEARSDDCNFPIIPTTSRVPDVKIDALIKLNRVIEAFVPGSAIGEMYAASGGKSGDSTEVVAENAVEASR